MELTPDWPPPAAADAAAWAHRRHNTNSGTPPLARNQRRNGRLSTALASLPLASFLPPSRIPSPFPACAIHFAIPWRRGTRARARRGREGGGTRGQKDSALGFVPRETRTKPTCQPFSRLYFLSLSFSLRFFPIVTFYIAQTFSLYS